MVSVTNKSRRQVVLTLADPSVPGYTVRGRKVPQTVTLQPGETRDGLPDSVAQLREVVAGRRSGKLSFTFQATPTPPKPKAEPKPKPKKPKAKRRSKKAADKAADKTETPTEG